MSPSAALSLSHPRPRPRALQAAPTDPPAATVAASANATVARCSSEALGSATFGSPAQLACAQASKFSFFLLSSRPTPDEMQRMCRERACRTTVQAIQHAVTSECQLPNGGAALYLYRDVLEPVTRSCNFSGNDTSSSSGSSSSSSIGSDVVHPPEQTSTGSGSSGLGVVPILGLLCGAIACGLLAAFVAMQLKRRRFEAVLRNEGARSRQFSDGPPSMVAQLEESDAFYSRRSCAEFAAIAMASKSSSNQSRASTARSSKHSMSSTGETDLALLPSPAAEPPSIDMAFEAPALVMLRIPIAKIQLGELISQDGVGFVYAGTYDHQLPVAIKTLLPGQCQDATELSLFLDEAKLLGRLSHARIERLVGIAWDPIDRDPWLLTEYTSGGDLRGFLDRYAIEQQLVGFSIEKVRIALDVAEALQYLHGVSPVVLHRTLTSRNVRLNTHLEAVVTDIGVSRRRDTASSENVSGSLWTAPEVMMGKRYDEAADVFSFGVLLSEIDTHNLPYATARGPQTSEISDMYRRISTGDLCVSFSDRADPDMVALGKQCIALHPRDRPTAHDLFQRVSHVMKSYVAFV